MYREAESVSGTTTPGAARRFVPLLAATLVAAGWAAPRTAVAQPGPGEIGGEVAAVGGTVAGSDFRNVGVGFGGQAGLRYGLTTRLSLGLVGHGSWHEAKGLDGSLRLLGAFLEPRYVLGGTGSGIRPFVGLRLGAARWGARQSADTLTADVSAYGLQAGGTAGVSHALGDAASLEVAAVASFLSFGNAEVDAALGERELPSFMRGGSGTRGSLLGVRTLLRVRVP